MPGFSHDVEALLWCMRPALDLVHLRGPLPDKIRWTPIEERPFRPATHSKYDGFFVATETVNQARALDPLMADTAEPLTFDVLAPQERLPVLTDPAVTLALGKIYAVLADRVSRAVFAAFENQLYKVALALAQYRAIDLSQFAGVVVSTQHSPIMRALLVAAGEQQVPVVYVPHAPVAANNAYLDLPAAYVGLRGAGEVDYYRDQFGLGSAALNIVGNLASSMLQEPLPTIQHDASGVLALSPHPIDTIRRIFTAIDGPGLGSMTVAPHPRSNLDEIRECLPAGWSLVEDTRTLDLLAAGAPFIIQFSSGVAWESAALGIPTATVHIDDAPVNYPFLADEKVYPAIRQPADAARFAASARAGEIDRDRLRAHAVRWCAIDGEQAATKLQELLDQVKSSSGSAATAMLHDGWGRDGRALQNSWIAGSPVAP